MKNVLRSLFFSNENYLKRASVEKRISIIFWFLSSCSFLWLYNLAAPKHLTPVTSFYSIFDSFFHFSFMILGAGWCYHFITLLHSSPLNDENKVIWRVMAIKLLFMAALLVSVPIVVILLSEYVARPWSYFVSYVWVVIAMMGALAFHATLKCEFDNINHNN